VAAPTTEIVVTREGSFATLRARPRSAAGGPGRPADGAAAPVIVLLHGFPDHPPTFTPMMAELAAAGLEVVAPWMRGYAPSMPGGPYDARQLASDAVALADAVAGDRPVYLVGHDWGAVATYAACTVAPARFRAAVAIAVPHPLALARALVTTGQLARSWYMLAFQLPGAVRAVAARDLAFVDWLWRRWSPGYALPEAARAELHACLAASLPAPIAYYRALTSRAGLAVFLDRGRRARRVATPVLQLQGARDGCIAPSAGRDQERFFAGPFERVVMPGVGHFLQAEDPRGTATQILRWLAAHPPAAIAG
jgi:pimeloyl-ACP methyl ester carboxylesterase